MASSLMGCKCVEKVVRKAEKLTQGRETHGHCSDGSEEASDQFEAGTRSIGS